MGNRKVMKADRNFDLNQIIREVRKYWYLFASSIFGFFLAAVLFIKFAAPVCQIGSTMLLTTPETSRNINPSEFLEGFELMHEEKELENEILILQSSPLIRNVIQDLNLNLTYYVKEDYIPHQVFFVFREIYDDVPFEVVKDENSPQPVDVKFYVKILNGEEFHMNIREHDVEVYDYLLDKVVTHIHSVEINDVFRFGEEIKSPYYSFKILLNAEFENFYADKDLYFSFNNIANLTAKYKASLEVSPSDIQATIVDIIFKGSNVKKSIDFVNGLTNAYLERSLNKKNHLAVTTIDYINQQLEDISDSLIYSEQQLQEFRSRYQIMNIDSKAGRVYEQLQVLEAQKTQLVNNLRFYSALDRHFEIYKDSANIRAPSTMGVSDDLMNNQIQELATLNSEKNSLIQSNQLRNPRLQTINVRIEDLKKTISGNVKFIINSTQMSLDQVNEDISRARYEEYKLPQTQRRLTEIERRFNLNDAVYTFLLQKRAEAQIAKASNLPDSEIIEPAQFLATIFPNKKFIYAIAFFLGLFFPGGYIVIINALNYKIQDIEDISAITDIPLLGYVLHNDKRSNNVLLHYPQSPISESFRTIRAKLMFNADEEKRQVILVTSTFEQEGKSFNAMNLATSLALFNKKIILLGFDLRKPSMQFKEFGTGDLLGISSFLVNKTGLDEIIVHTGINNLDIIKSGQIPPNPGELIASMKTHELIIKLKERYDFIILDTPPISPIADAYQLMKHSDVNIFVVRQNFTPKKPFLIGIHDVVGRDIKNKYMLFNDVNPQSKLDRYRYGSTYYFEEKGGIFKRKTQKKAKKDDVTVK